MKKEAIFIQKSIRVIFTAVYLIIFVSSILLLSKTGQSASARTLLSPFPTRANTIKPEPPTSSPTPSPSPCASWNLASDFRISPNQENPNRDSCNNLGIWEFMGSSGLDRVPAAYYTMSTFTASGGLNMWQGNNGEGHISFNASGVDYIAGAIIWPANTVDVHPGLAQMVVMAWHSPVNGYISVSGSVSDNNPYIGNCNNQDGILWYIDKNSTNIASGGFVNGGSQSFSSGTNGANLNTVSVVSGDVIYLAIHPDGNYYCDDTFVDLAINVTTAPTSTPTATITYTPTRTLTPTNTATSTPIVCGWVDYEVQGVTGNNGLVRYYGVSGYSHIWNPTVGDTWGVYVNSVWIRKDMGNIVELGWYKDPADQGDEREYFRMYVINGIPSPLDHWGTPATNTDHEFRIYNVNADQEWRFYVDGNQRTPNIQIPGFTNGVTAAMRERHTTCDSGWAHMWALQKLNSADTWSSWGTITEVNGPPYSDKLWFLDIVSASEFFVSPR